ncbi:MAG TPA: GntG family PLP-dependent aldolase [Chitinophagaceae bacterium]|nr:GntG family PLP-dependent aldolase [Chitinophagaceae bacterium]
MDYRSDTVTRPGPEMMEAMMQAPVGDDVLGDDPSVMELESWSARMFGKEAALFCPSGTMTNQIATKVHTQPGDEVICDFSSHIYQYEGGGIAFNAGASVKLLHGDRGRVTAAQVEEGINADDVHKARTSLVSLENTANRGGGACYNLEEVRAIRKLCDRHGLMLHLDGARVFNAIVEKGEDPLTYGALFHSISVCLSKGLGAPVGSVLIGDAPFIRKARRIRKVFGGGMRQAGYLAAAGLFALKENVQRLRQDHDHARILEETLSGLPFVTEVLPVETNIVIFGVRPPFTAPALVERMKELGILAYAIAPMQVRLVTHLDISPAHIEKTVDLLKQL